MDSLISLLFFAIILLPFVALALRNTNLWPVPGVLLMGGALLMLVTITPVEDDVGGIGALGNGLQVLGGLFLGGLALLSFALGGIKRRKPAPPATVALPVARTLP